MGSIEKRDHNRHALLRAVYELADGEATDVDYSSMYKKGEELGMSHEETESAFSWLQDKGLLKGHTNTSFTLKREGVDEMEESLRDPAHRTEHFPPIATFNTINIHGGAVGSVQTGSHNVANVAQQFNTSAVADVLKLIEQLKGHLGEVQEEHQQEATELVEAIEEQAKSSSPKASRVKSYAQALQGYMVPYIPLITEIVKHFLIKPQ